MDDKKFQSLTKAQQDVVLKIAAEAERQGVNPRLAIAIAEAETGGQFNQFKGDKVLTSPAGARGIMQIMPDTAQLYNKNLGADINPDDEDSNIRGGVFILKDLLTKYKSPRIAVAMYNASPRANAEFVKKYETDPDAAILSLKPETHKYSLRVSQNFNLDDDKETGLIPPQGEGEGGGDPFASYESEAGKFKRELEEAKRRAEENKPPPEANPDDRPGGLDAPETGALAGAATNLLFPMMTSPELPTKIDPSKAQERATEAADKLELAQQNLRRAVPQGVESLNELYSQSQSELERIKNEQLLIESRLKGMPPPPAPAPELSPDQLKVESRKIPGAGAPYNTVQAFASERVPFLLASEAIDMTHGEGHGRGAHDIVDEFNRGKAKVANLGLSDWVLTGEKGPAELYLPPELAGPKNEEIEQRNERNRNQQALFAQQQEQERLRLQAELDRVRQERAEAGKRHNVVTGQTKVAAPMQRALTKAETDAEIARRRLARAQQQPGPLTRPLEVTGVKSATMGAIPRTIVGGGAGYLGVMSYQEALARLKAGDTSEGVLQALQAGSAAAMLTPPVGQKLTRLRGAGTLGTGALGAYQLGRRLLKDRPPEE